MDELEKVRAGLIAKLKKLACKKAVLLRRLRIRHVWSRLEALEKVMKG